MRFLHYSLLLGLLVLVVSVSASAYAADDDDEELIPVWIRNAAQFWINKEISDKEFLQTLQYLIDNGILTVQTSETVAPILTDKKNEKIKNESPIIKEDITSASEKNVEAVETYNGKSILDIGETFHDEVTGESYSLVMAMSKQIMIDKSPKRGNTSWTTIYDKASDGFDWYDLDVKIKTEKGKTVKPYFNKNVGKYEIASDDRPKYLFLAVGNEDLVYWNISESSKASESCLDTANDADSSHDLISSSISIFDSKYNSQIVRIFPNDSIPSNFVSMEVLDHEGNELFSESLYLRSIGDIRQFVIPDSFDRSKEITLRSCVEGHDEIISVSKGLIK